MEKTITPNNRDSISTIQKVTENLFNPNNDDNEKKKLILLDKLSSEDDLEFKYTQPAFTPSPDSRLNTNTFKVIAEKIQDSTVVNPNRVSDLTITNQDGISQFFRKDSKLNLSISRISLKNTFAQENTSSKLRSVYKKVNDNILNITNVKQSDNQFIKFFTNNSLYENQKKDSAPGQKSTNDGVLRSKTPNSVITAKKLASEVINIYRKNISKQINTTDEKNEAKDLINKQAELYRGFADKIVKKKHIPEVDVETIMRAPIQKYAKSSFPCKNNQTLISIAKANVTQINTNSRVLSPIGNHKDKFKSKLEEENTKLEESKIENTVRKSLLSYHHFLNKQMSRDSIFRNSLMDTKKPNLEEIEEKDKVESLFNNKYKNLVQKVI